MSVVVRGMEMPKDCIVCYETTKCFGTGICFEDGSIWCRLAKGYIGLRDTSEKCPLVELPEKHGRLGDLDELKTSFADSINECKKWIKELEENGDNETLPLANQAFCTFVEAALRLKSIPTIVEAEGE